MRKASQDGGDSTSITSGFDSDIKKPGAGILKTKKTSIKRKVQNFSLESDDGVIEPLLQKDKEIKEKSESGNPSAKLLLSKTKTDSMSDKSDEKVKLLDDNKTSVPSMTSVPGITHHRGFANGIKEDQITKSYASAAPIHNHMHTNVFASNEMSSVPKTQMLVEIDERKQKSYSPSPLIFTTAKIHTDGKTKPLEPVHVTPMPILSTIEGNVVKTEPAASGNNSKSDITNTRSGDHATSANTVSTVSVTFYSEILNKGTERKEKSDTSTQFACQPFVVTELKTFKYIPSEGKVKDITASKDTTKTKASAPVTDKIFANISLSQTTSSVPAEMVKTTIIEKQYNHELPNSTTATVSKTESSDSSSIPISQRTTIAREIATDSNKNIVMVNVETSKQPDTAISDRLKPLVEDSKELQKKSNSQLVTLQDNKDKGSVTQVTPTICDESKKSANNSHSMKANTDFMLVTTETQPKSGASSIVLSSNINVAPPTSSNVSVQNSASDIKLNNDKTKTISTDVKDIATTVALSKVITKPSPASPVTTKTTTKPISATTIESNKSTGMSKNEEELKNSKQHVEKKVDNLALKEEISNKLSEIGSTCNAPEKKSISTIKTTVEPTETKLPTKTSADTNVSKISKFPTGNPTTLPNLSKACPNKPLATGALSKDVKISSVSVAKSNASTSSSQEVSNLPLTTSSTSLISKTSIEINPKSTKTPSLSPTNTVKISLEYVTKTATLVSSSVKSTVSPITSTSVTSKPTVSTIETSTSKTSTIPKTDAKSVTSTVESSTKTKADNKENVEKTSDHSKNDKPKA